MRLSRWLLATLPLFALAFGQTCYWPSGSIASALQPCSVSSGNEVAACCFQNHYCMTNGLCLSPTEGTWYRGGCTDKDYQKTGCPKFCDKDGIVGSTPGRHAAVWACASKSFACGSLDNCPKQNFTVGPYRAVMNLALQTDLANDTATATATVTNSASETASTGGVVTGDASTETCASSAEASHGISTSAAAGIGVGVGLPLTIAVAALTVMLLREKKRAREAMASYQHHPDHSQQPSYSTATSPWGKPEAAHYASPAEVSGQSLPPELPDNSRGRQELSHS